MICSQSAGFFVANLRMSLVFSGGAYLMVHDLGRQDHAELNQNESSTADLSSGVLHLSCQQQKDREAKSRMKVRCDNGAVRNRL